MYVYIKSNPGLWTVGFYDPSGQWHAENDYDDSEKAAARVYYLNGGRGAADKRSLPNPDDNLLGALHAWISAEFFAKEKDS